MIRKTVRTAKGMGYFSSAACPKRRAHDACVKIERLVHWGKGWGDDLEEDGE